jgi:hypothetical protein
MLYSGAQRDIDDYTLSVSLAALAPAVSQNDSDLGVADFLGGAGGVGPNDSSQMYEFYAACGAP